MVKWGNLVLVKQGVQILKEKADMELEAAHHPQWGMMRMGGLR